jgi:hypothetical protein
METAFRDDGKYPAASGHIPIKQAAGVVFT